MSTCPAERSPPGVTTEQLLDAARRAKAAAGEMTAAGTPVSYRRSTFLTGHHQTCHCLFEGPSELAVAQAHDTAGIPYRRIVPTVPAAPEDLA